MKYGAYPSAPLTVSVDALLTTDIALLEQERSEESGSQGYDDTQVCCCLGPVLASDGPRRYPCQLSQLAEEFTTSPHPRKVAMARMAKAVMFHEPYRPSDW